MQQKKRSFIMLAIHIVYSNGFLLKDNRAERVSFRKTVLSTRTIVLPGLRHNEL